MKLLPIRWSAALAFAVFIIVAGAHMASAQSASELQSQINDHNAQIQKLNKEIAAYEKQLTEVGAKKQTLQNTLSQLDIQRKKITASISVTKNKIKTLQLQIQSLSKNIEGKQGSIRIEEEGLAETVRSLHATQSETLATAILSSDDITDIWNDIDATRV